MYIYIHIRTNYTFLQISMFVSLYKVSWIPPSRSNSSTQGQDVRPYLVQYLACLDPCGAHLYGWHAASRLLAWTDGKDIAIWGNFRKSYHQYCWSSKWLQLSATTQDLGGLQPPSASKLLHRAIAEARCLVGDGWCYTTWEPTCWTILDPECQSHCTGYHGTSQDQSVWSRWY